MRCRSTFSRNFARRAAVLSVLLSSCALVHADPRTNADDSATDTETIVPLSAEAQAALRDALVFDPTRWMDLKPVAPRSPAQKASAQDLDWNRTDKPDGSSAVTVKKPLPLEWDAKVGADFGLAPTYGNNYQPDKTLPYGKEQNSGAPWASVTVPGIASIDARVDPSKDQSKLGTTISRSVPVGSAYSVTLQNSIAVTETLASAQGANAGSPGTPSQVWTNDRLVKFNFLSTGTSFAAGTMSSTAGTGARNKISAEQKLFDGLNITTSVTDVGAASTSKSVTAGFKWKW